MISLAQFGALLVRCCGGVPRGNIVVALSGGVDSMCLTYLLAHLPNRQYEIHAVTVDHQYRAGSGAEAAQVGEIVRLWGVNHVIKLLRYGEFGDVKSITNFEEVAREKRYQVFRDACKEHGAALLFTGHNMNDKLETFVQRLSQNSTLYGLVGMRCTSKFPLVPTDPSEHIVVVRPLLEYTKSDIRELAVQNKIKWFEDHTNHDIHLTQRNLTRHWMDQNKLSMDSLKSVYTQLEKCDEMLEEKVTHLREYLVQTDSISTNPSLCSVLLKLPKLYLVPENNIVLSRFLYQTLACYSSVKHYHWMYAKLERSVVPNLIATRDSGLTVTALNLRFQQVSDGEYVTIAISRQNMEKETYKDNIFELYLSNHEWSRWCLYDRRMWIRVRLRNDTRLQIVPYCNRIHGRMLRKTFALKQKTSIYESVPIVVTSDDHIVAVPAAGLHNPDYNHVDVETNFLNTGNAIIDSQN